MFTIDSKKLYIILASGIAILVFITVILILRGTGNNSEGPRVNLEFWGVFDTYQDFSKTISNFQAIYPNISVNYKQFSFEDYEKELINALAEGRGPDILMIHNTWLPKHIDKLVPLPASIPPDIPRTMTFREYQNQFVEVAVNDLTRNGQIYAIPLYVDTLALYYNRDLFNNAGITEPPRNWDEFNYAVERLTRFDSFNNIVQAGAAIGTSNNINRSTDILMALMIQSGTQMTDDKNTIATFAQSINNIPVGEIALKYYTDFANPKVKTYTWNDIQDYSIDAFAAGKVAMMFNYSHQTKILNAKNARLNYLIAPMPQISDTNIKNFANYWAVAVSKKTSAVNEAWKFLSYLSTRDGILTYLTETMKPSARRDIIEIQKNDFRLGVFANQSITAKSWYQVDNSAIETIFSEMINNVNSRRMSPSEAISKAQSEVNVLMTKNRR
jgi:multiple sugar transport system substrate-binding protein